MTSASAGAATSPELEATLKNLPDRPGVYLMKDPKGQVLYVGKAQSLRHRVRSYWQRGSGGHRDLGRLRRRERFAAAENAAAFGRRRFVGVLVRSAEASRSVQRSRSVD